MKKITNLFCIAFLAIGLIGCATKLEPGGKYAPTVQVVENGVTNTVAAKAPDVAFYAIDGTFKFLQAGIESIFTTERENRAFFWAISHDIKHKLDDLRDQSWEIEVAYAKARKVYKANPTPAGLSELQTWVDRLAKINKSVQTVIPKTK